MKEADKCKPMIKFDYYTAIVCNPGYLPVHFFTGINSRDYRNPDKSAIQFPGIGKQDSRLLTQYTAAFEHNTPLLCYCMKIEETDISLC